MTDGKMLPSKRSSKGPFKSLSKRLLAALGKSPTPSTSLEPSALGQENPGKEMYSVSHAIVASGTQLVNPGIGASAVTSRQGISRFSFPRQTVHSRMQIITPRYRDHSDLSQVQAHPSLQKFRVNKFQNVCDSSN